MATSSIFHDIIIDTPQKVHALLDALEVSKRRTACAAEPMGAEVSSSGIAEEAG